MIAIQAIILAIIYVIMTVVYILAVRPYEHFPVVTLVVQSLLWLVYIALIVYDTNCLVAGSCVAWAWLRTFLYAIIPAIVIYGLVIYLTEQANVKKAFKDAERAAAEKEDEEAVEEFKSAPRMRRPQRPQWF